MKTKILLFASLLSITLFIGCNSNEAVDTSATSSVVTTDDAVVNSEIDATVDDVSIIAEDQFDMQKSSAAKTSSGMVSLLPTCATITTVLTNDTWTRTIDFGTQGCALPNGNIVKGKIIISFSKNFTTPIKTISYTLVGFYHNGKLIEGTKTITHELKSTDILTAIHPVTTHSIDVKITYPDGKIYSRIGTRVREMVDGFTSIMNWEDNIFKVWGYHITTFPNGSKYTCTIQKTSPLLIKMSCKMPFPVSGVVEITKNDGKATLDYGKGDCDDLATITVNGVSKEIHLKK
jgi:outer membrane murein-binding lipoprotein Lpp